MTQKTIKAGLMAVALGLLVSPDLGRTQDTDYQILASSQFAEPKTIGPGPVKVVLGPSGPLEAELANPIERRILMVVRGTRQHGAPIVPVSVYWNLPDGSRKLDDERLLGTVTLLDHFGGKDHTTVLDVTDSLRTLSRIKETPEPQGTPQPSVTLVAPAADEKNTGPKIEEVLLVASAKPPR
jgi:hypothetical protein